MKAACDFEAMMMLLVLQCSLPVVEEVIRSSRFQDNRAIEDIRRCLQRLLSLHVIVSA